MKVCILCNVRPAAVPDREVMGRPIKKVCRECHQARLRGDAAKIMGHYRKQLKDEAT